MKLILWITCLTFACGTVMGEEPIGGLADRALVPSDIGQWTRRVQYLFDPKATPSEIFQVATNFSRRRPALSADDVEKLRNKGRRVEALPQGAWQAWALRHKLFWSITIPHVVTDFP